MRNTLLLAIILLLFPISSQAQKYLEGRWEGALVQHGKEYILKMDIKRSFSKVEAEIYCITNDTTFTRTVAKGRLYSDRSVYLEDFKIVFPDDPKTGIHFKKKFQLLYDRDFNTLTLDGYWQELGNISKVDQKIGQVRLKRIIDKRRA